MTSYNIKSSAAAAVLVVLLLNDMILFSHTTQDPQISIAEGKKQSLSISSEFQTEDVAFVAVQQPFDWRDIDGDNLVSMVQSSTNPPGCDAGWAFAAASMLADRLAIRQKDDIRATKLPLSAQMILNCATPVGKDGCNTLPEDSEMQWVFERALLGGVTDMTCQNYRGKQESCTLIDTCINCFGGCAPVFEHLVYNVSAYGMVNLSDVGLTSLEAEVKANGPVACKFNADQRLPSGTRPFYASVVGWTTNMTHLIANPNWGTFQGNDTTTSAVPGFYLLHPEMLRECWYATPHLEGKGWVAHHSDNGEMIPKNITKPAKQSKKKKHSKTSPSHYSSTTQTRDSSQLPVEFDWRQVVGHLTPIQSHHTGPIYCGACYSMATTSTYSDALKIRRHKTNSAVEDVIVAAQSVIDCVEPREGPSGCTGNSAKNVFTYMETTGLSDISCNPFESAWFQDCESHLCLSCNAADSTTEECERVPDGQFTTFTVNNTGLLSAATPAERVVKMQEAIYRHGPIDCMMTDDDPTFLHFDGEGIYCNPSNKTGHDHDVSLFGWGEELNTTSGETIKYWWGRNSWGTKWADNGWFRICRGVDKFGIEADLGCAFVVPGDL